jgi:uncharacterized protein (TIGR03435 family)
MARNLLRTTAMIAVPRQRLLIALILTAAAPGQTRLPPASAQFEVASVKPHPGVDRPVSIGSPSPGRFRAENVWLRFLIEMAWNVKDFQVSGGPAWASSDRFDISAEIPANVRFEEMRPMLQYLLEDRFQLALHRASKELPVYALVAAKGGIKLQTSGEGDCVSRQKPRDSCGSMMTSPRSISGTAISMEQFTAALSNTMQRTVIDKTGFAGKFDVHLEWTEDQSTPGLYAPGLRPAGPAASPDLSGPAIFTVLQEKLGLKLESATAPVPTLVIDHAAKPSAN